ncbi:hypothetical protein RBE51_11460 [Pseudomonas taiwanensis]|uniref:hypothetical protein n=1 Tax=Pseudomonas taiwanensis TaxID=470150 RepID=UPI0028DFE164|nr:hypothetical protein [Pseudomonas taiwanensis]MDT8923431.1 hypothetical protein [Pseudomonas taiwanensis]
MNEIYSEWGRFCLRCRQVTETSEFSSAPVDLPQFDGATEFRMAANFSGGKLMIGTLYFVPYYEIDPLPITFHCDKAIASLREGYCLLVPVAVDTDWSEAVWPKSMAELDGYIANTTGYPRLVEDWIMRRRREPNKLLMVVLVKDNICYGYLLGSPRDGVFTDTRVIPVLFDRVEEFSFENRMLIELELSVRHLQTLIRHARQLQPSSGDVKEDQRLRYALDELASALGKGVSRSRLT